ncbi:MAG: F0F1 ATP synthase subunit C [Bacilli bacterium]
MSLNLVNFLADATSTVGFDKFFAIGLVSLALVAVGLGEGLVCMAGVKGISKNPEAASKIRTGMIIGCALVETEAIYSLVVMILLLFTA